MDAQHSVTSPSVWVGSEDSINEHRPSLHHDDNDDTSDDETEELLSQHQDGRLNITVYKRRWYVLLVFSVMGASQTAVWNTWAPLAQSAKVAFGWNTGVIALQENWGSVTYICSVLVCTWLIDVKGRWCVQG